MNYFLGMYNRDFNANVSSKFIELFIAQFVLFSNIAESISIRTELGFNY